MDIEEYRDYCLSLDGVAEKMPFERFFHGKHSFLAYYAGGRMFCYFDIDRFDKVNLRCPAGRIDDLRATYSAVGDPYNLSPSRWIGIDPRGDMPDAVMRQLTKLAYDTAADEARKQHHKLT